MLFLVLIFLELLVLFLSSRILTRTLSLFFYRVTKSQTTTVYLLSFLFLPGVIIHELAHLLSANLLFVRTGEVEFMPQIRGNRKGIRKRNRPQVRLDRAPGKAYRLKPKGEDALQAF